MRFVAAFFAMFLVASSVSLADSPDAGIPRGGGPGGVPFGAGDQRGMTGENNSGQSGFVTAFDKGARTGVVVQIDGTKGDEAISLERSASCDKPGPEALKLTVLHAGISRGYVDIPEKQLMSGKFIVVVFAVASPTHIVSCGELYN